MTTKRWRPWLQGGMIATCLLLSGCNTLEQLNYDLGTSHLFRNREYDYALYPIEQVPTLKVPPGVQQPLYEPLYILPPGPNAYHGNAYATITPPYYYWLAQIPASTTASIAPDKLLQMPPIPVNAKSTALLQQEMRVIQQEIAMLKTSSSLQGTDANSPVPASSPSETEASHVHESTPVIHTIPAPVAGKTQKSVPMTKLQPAKAVAQPQQTPTLPTASESGLGVALLHLQGVPTLQIAGAHDQIWQKVGQAIPKVGYTIVHSDETDGYYFIAPSNQSATNNTVLLDVMFNNQGANVVLYNTAGNPDTGSTAYQVLSQMANIVSEK